MRLSMPTQIPHKRIVFFPFTVALSLLIVLCTGGALYKSLLSFSEEDIQEYKTLRANTDPNYTSKNAPYTATQQHSQAHKDIWFMDNGQRLHLLLRSADTELILSHDDQETEVVENMINMTCFMQEELYYELPDGREVLRQPDGQFVLRHAKNAKETSELDIKNLKPMQVIRYMQADKASYFYQAERLEAENVKISRYIAPSHILINSLDGLTPLLKGVARSIEFSLANREIKFTAHQFKALLHSTKRPL